MEGENNTKENIRPEWIEVEAEVEAEVEVEVEGEIKNYK